MHVRIHWLKMLLVLPGFSFAQSLTLEQAYALARNNYPLIRQKELISQTAGLNISNLGKGYLPQFSINGQATYQSEVTKVDVPIPGIKIDALEKDQYKLTADIQQLVYDGGLTKQQKNLQQLNAVVEDQQVEVELYKIKERIGQLYLSVLYVDEQIRQVQLVKEDISTGLKKVEAQVQNGVAFRSNLNTLKAEFIRTDQRNIELRSARKSLIETLGLFVNKDLDENQELQRPDAPLTEISEVTRPEIKLFNDQYSLLEQQHKIISAKNLPRTSLFAQAGYGRPGLNMLKNQFDFFYIGGVRLNWSLAGFYTNKNDREIVHVNKKIVDTRKEVFLLNTHTEIKKQQSEISKLNQLIHSDDEIIELRKSVTDAAKAQLENGVITANDYLREVNAEDQARQSRIAHQIQLLQAQINYQTIIGK